MKQSDLALLIVVIILSVAISFFTGNALFNGPEKRAAEVEQVKRINERFPAVDASIFNKDRAINLTENIKIGDGGSSNPGPFEGN